MEQRPVVIAPRFRPLFDSIVYRDYDRVNVVAPTQDGKSLTIAVAVTLVAAIAGERFTIIAPSQKKADIIMKYIIEFAVEAPLIRTQLQLDNTKNLERLKRERSKQNITFLRGGGVQTLTLDAKNASRSHEAAMGFGAKNIIADESGLVSDKLWSTVLRMLGGDFKDDKRKKLLVKIGNPFYDNHFKRSSESPRYFQISHNYKDSIRDYEAGFYGYSPEFMDEARDEPLFEILYECKFPTDEEIDEKGYRQLVLDNEIGIIPSLNYQDDVNKVSYVPLGKPKLGCDIGGGGDYNVFCVRWLNIAMFIKWNKSDDTMSNVTVIEDLVKEFGIAWSDVGIDDIGIGRGVTDRLREKGYAVNGVTAGAKASTKKKQKRFANAKAELYWATREWIKRGGKTVSCVIGSEEKAKQIKVMKYKVNSDRCIIIEPKSELKKRTKKSPDFAEALMITFYKPAPIFII